MSLAQLLLLLLVFGMHTYTHVVVRLYYYLYETSYNGDLRHQVDPDALHVCMYVCVSRV
jgi:hypothetical protein